MYGTSQPKNTPERVVTTKSRHSVYDVSFSWISDQLLATMFRRFVLVRTNGSVDVGTVVGPDGVVVGREHRRLLWEFAKEIGGEDVRFEAKV